ncbi:hypothetical protein L3Y34_012857 [Caenorhabditis briggsae]|uniref:Uncharacterized protein n=1 Tax=Caenorhabditis briggsae TaxID=6238 RepID=A0AAE9CVN6_CAEBR|nr:hypothetical protein L3Y34_012857 [Caenorhabditis briggsae]
MDNVMHHPRNIPDNELDFLEVILQALAHYLPVLRADPEVPQEVLLLFREIKMIGEMLYVIGCEPRTQNGMEIIENLYREFRQLYHRLQHNVGFFQELFNN